MLTVTTPREATQLPVLKTVRLELSVLRPEDADELIAFRLRNRERLRPWSPPEPPDAQTLEAARRSIERMHAELHSGSAYAFWFRSLSQPNGPLVGGARLSNVMLGPFRACYLGYQLDGDSVGQGLMQEALSEIIRFAFDELRLHRIMANYVPTNERSGRLLRRLGFVVEGYARDYLFIGGRFQDHVLTALTNGALSDAESLCTPSS